MSRFINTLRGSINVITGCTSGLGRATLQWFLKQGCGPVLGIDRQVPDNFANDLDVSDEQRKKLSIRTHSTYDEALEPSLQEFVSTHGPIDNLINVAGVALSFGLLVDNQDGVKLYDLRHTYDLLDFNTVGTFNMIRLASRYMIDTKPNETSRVTKCIVNTSCISSTRPSIGQSFYAATTSSIDSMTLCVAREFSTLNIRCNTINVGFFDTPLMRNSDEKVCNYIESSVAQCPKRLGHPDEFAHLAQSIVENQMLNGACISLDACAYAAHSKVR